MIKVAIAGFGKIGQVRAREILRREDVTLVAVHDIERPDVLPKDVNFVRSYSDLLALDIDAVFVCAVNNVLAEYTMEAVLKGVHVFCEKPGARSSDELLPIMELEAKSNIVLKYGFNHRFHYSVIEAKKIIATGELGKMLWIRGVYGKAGSIDYHKNWRNYKKFSGGGILIDQGIHMLDLMHFFSGEKFENIKSFVNTSYWNIEAEDNAFIIMQSKSNVIAMMHSSATQWRHKFSLEMTFEEGYINLDGILSETRSYSPEKLTVGKREFEDITHAMGKPAEKTIWFENDNSWSLEIDEFFSAIKSKGKVKNGRSQAAYESLKTIEKIYAAALDNYD